MARINVHHAHQVVGPRRSCRAIGIAGPRQKPAFDGEPFAGQLRIPG